MNDDIYAAFANAAEENYQSRRTTTNSTTSSLGLFNFNTN